MQWAVDVNKASCPRCASISYTDQENSATLRYAQRVNVEMQKFAARGMSVLVSSGDNGTGGA